MIATPLPGKDAARRAELEALFSRLEAAPWAFDFFALMRRVDALVPGAPRLGRAQLPAQEPLRLGQVPELDFAPAALARFESSGGAAPRLGVRFFGLLGPQGPMPLHLTEYVRERSRQRGDPTAARFLDLFHHRLLTLFYRAWAQHQPVVQADRPADDRYAAWLGAAQGIAPDLPSRSVLPDTALLYQTGLIASRSKHPEALSKVLRQYFGIPVAVQMYMPHWLMLSAEDRSQLGYARNRPEQRRAGAAVLGRSATAGHKVWDRQYKFRIALGPLTMAQYERFLPGGRAWPALREWVRLLAGADLVWDLQLGLRGADVPPPRLGRHMRLGLTSWVGGAATRGGAVSADRHDLRLRPGSSFLLRRRGTAHG